VFAQLPGQSNALGGLRGVKVLIFTNETELKRLDFTADLLKTDIELRLRKAGVPVLPGKEWPQGYQKAVLVLSLLSVQDEETFAVSITLQLWRVVEGSGSAPALNVSTWQTPGVGIFGSLVIKRSVRDAIGDDVDKFANDYLAANPK